MVESNPQKFEDWKRDLEERAALIVESVKEPLAARQADRIAAQKLAKTEAGSSDNEKEYEHRLNNLIELFNIAENSDKLVKNGFDLADVQRSLMSAKKFLDGVKEADTDALSIQNKWYKYIDTILTNIEHDFASIKLKR